MPPANMMPFISESYRKYQKIAADFYYFKKMLCWASRQP
ncbi:hypothetical protein COXBURSA331_A2033 [Coxiella burnetii RSA 331]|nr:hypothetical protein COXBURSA331_A2033 [Coxiella burnetii RSA 331]EDR36742.1 hypothetical protein COXBURSA334_2090 [Coxiella burnetii Q321]